MRTSRSQHVLLEGSVIAFGAVLGLLWGLEQATAWVLGGLILLGALTAVSYTHLTLPTKSSV